MARKKGSGEGTIYKRDKGWRGQMRIGGKRVSFSGKTKSEVIEKISAARTDHNRGAYVFDNDITVREYSEIWLDKYQAPRLTEQTLVQYEGLFNNHILPTWGEIKLQDLNKQELEQGYAEIFSKKDYSHQFLNIISSQLKAMLNQAVIDEIIVKTPHLGVRLNKLRPPKKVSAYSREDHLKIIEHCQNSKLDYVFYFMITTGVRFGEAVALNWDDVDLKNQTVSINKTSVELHGSPVIQDKPKTLAGIRTISIGKSVTDFLVRIKSEQDPELNMRNLVFPNSRYNIITSANYTRRWQMVCDKLKIEYIGKHSLRHTWATRALEEGTNVKVVSVMLGHKDVITTMNIYQDVLASFQSEVVAGLEKWS